MSKDFNSFSFHTSFEILYYFDRSKLLCNFRSHLGNVVWQFASFTSATGVLFPFSYSFFICTRLFFFLSFANIISSARVYLTDVYIRVSFLVSCHTTVNNRLEKCYGACKLLFLPLSCSFFLFSFTNWTYMHVRFPFVFFSLYSPLSFHILYLH